jgi:hypothetical protein
VVERRGPSEALAFVGFMVQLGQPGWPGSVLHFHRGNALDFESGLRLGVTLSAANGTVTFGGAVFNL